MRWIPVLAGCGLGVLMAPTIARAAPASEDDRIRAATVAEVIVTAQKREENLQSVPIAISAYTSKQRDLIGVETVQDLAKFTPGLTYATSIDRTFIRGVGRETNNLSTQPGVATYFDGVYNSSIVAASGDTLFLDRVEVLRGPQGTLYGKNAIGGAVNAISRRPTDEFYAEARAKFGNYGVYDLEAAVSGPITDDVRFRIAGYRNEQARGFFKNVSGLKSEGGNGVVDYLEGQLAARFGSSVELWVKLDAYGFDQTADPTVSPSHWDTTPFPPGVLGPNPGFGFTQPGFTEIGSATQNPGATNLRDFSANTPSRARLTDSYGATTQVVWHTPWAADLTYIGGFTQYRYNSIGDADGTSLTSFQFPTDPAGFCATDPQCSPLTVFATINQLFTENKTYFSNELDLSSTGQSPLQWIVGLYEYHEQFEQDLRFSEPFQRELATPIAAADPSQSAAPNPSLDLYSAGQKMKADSYAGFAQIDWRVAPTIKLSGGLRYTYDRQAGVEATREICFGVPACGASAAAYGAFTPAIDITQFLVSFTPAPGVAGPTTLDPATGLFSRRLSASWSAVTGTAGVEWTPDSASLVYAKYSRGYKSGGFNSGPIFAVPETGPEFLDAYELGVKHDFGRTLRVDTAIFYYNYDGMQIPLAVQVAPFVPATTVYVNINRVRSYGLEVEGTWQPTEGLQFILNYSYLNARVRSSRGCFVDGADPFSLQPGANTAGCPAGGENVTGQAPPQSPPNKVVVAGNYTWRLASGALTLSGDYAWTDSTYDAIFNRSYYLAPAYDTVDMRLLWTDAKGRYTAILYAKNLFNTLGFDNAVAGLMGDGTIGRGFGLTAPATYGVELQYRFR